MGDPIEKDFAEPRPRPAVSIKWVCILALAASITALLINRYDLRRELDELERLRELRRVPNLHITAEEFIGDWDNWRTYSLRVINLDQRAVKDLQIIIEPMQQGVELPPESDIKIDPPLPASVAGGPGGIIIRFGQPLLRYVDVVVPKIKTRPYGYGVELVRTWVYTKQGEARIARHRYSWPEGVPAPSQDEVMRRHRERTPPPGP